jgi:CheY-like chemotaxis protein
VSADEPTPATALGTTPAAPKPVILAVDDDLPVLAALEEVALGGGAVALIVADQRMPAMSGVDLLERAITLHRDVRTVLLTAYADTNAAIDAINKIRLDHHILKPWDPRTRSCTRFSTVGRRRRGDSGPARAPVSRPVMATASRLERLIAGC